MTALVELSRCSLAFHCPFCYKRAVVGNTHFIFSISHTLLREAAACLSYIYISSPWRHQDLRYLQVRRGQASHSIPSSATTSSLLHLLYTPYRTSRPLLQMLATSYLQGWPVKTSWAPSSGTPSMATTQSSLPVGVRRTLYFDTIDAAGVQQGM